MSFDPSIEGWFEPADAEAYAALARPILNGLLVEVGVWKGRSLSAVAEICRENRDRILAVDTWKGSAEHAHLDTSRLYEGFWEVVVAHRWDEFVIPFRGESTEVAARLASSGRHIDLVFVDGAHDYESVMADLKAWSPLVKEGGTLAGHDYSPGGGGSVAEAVEANFAGRIQRAPAGSSVWWVRL